MDSSQLYLIIEINFKKQCDLKKKICIVHSIVFHLIHISGEYIYIYKYTSRNSHDYSIIQFLQKFV